MFFKNKNENQKRVKTPTILQMESLECGAAALSIILSYYNRFVTLPELRVACGVSRDGSKAINIMKAAREYGLETTAYRKDIDLLRKLKPPYIIFWNFNHFLVVEGFKDDKVYLNDPARGPVIISLEEFNKSYTGVVFTFKLTENFKPGGQKPTFIPALVKRFKGQKLTLTFLILICVGIIIPGILLPAYIKLFIDGYLVLRITEWLYPLLIGLLLTSIIRGILAWLQSYYLLRFRMQLSLSSSSQFFWHILHLPMIFFSQRIAGDIAQRMQINNRVADLLSNRFIATILNLITATFFIILMFLYSVPLSIICISIALLNVVILRYAAYHQININKTLSVYWGKLFGTTMNGLQLIETFKSMGAEDDLFARWTGQFTKVSNATQKAGFYPQILDTISLLILNINNIIVLGVGGYLVMQGQLTVGTLVAFQTLLTNFSQPINELMNTGSLIQQMHGDMNRLDDVMNYPEQKDTTYDIPLSIGILKPKLDGSLELRNVTFGYNLLEPPLIEDFSLTLSRGKRIAIIGPSSSGRSTIARLILGLYKPWSGQILFEGRPRNYIPHNLFVNSVSMVTQESRLFEGSLRDNITLWDTTLAEANIIQAAKDAEIYTLIAARQDGFDTHVIENGNNFSGGERQRIEIARALATNPSLLILDEATSALDSPVEASVMKNILLRGCSTLVIAHRLSAIRDCDEIIVVDKGRIVQQGTHEDLIKEDKGLYLQLIRAH